VLERFNSSLTVTLTGRHTTHRQTVKHTDSDTDTVSVTNAMDIYVV